MRNTGSLGPFTFCGFLSGLQEQFRFIKNIRQNTGHYSDYKETAVNKMSTVMEFH